jgi:hypothetical protein
MAQIQIPSLTSLNNSLVVGQSRFDVNKFTDLNSLYSLYKRESFTTYKGMIHLWNQRRLMNTPLINMTEMNSSVMYINGAEGKFRYSVPYNIGLPYIVEDLTGGIEKPGIDGQKFKIKLSENCYTNTDIITYDYRDGVSLYITEEEIYEESDGWVYTVALPQANKKNFFPKRFLQPGTEYMKITNVNGEYDTQKSSIWLRQGALDLEMQVGGGRSVYHWITAYADMLKVDGGDPRYGYLNQYSDLRKNNSTLVFFNKDQNGKPIPQSMKWMNRIEALLWAEMKMMEERDLMWSKGGIVTGSGRRSVRVNTGLYEQLRNGNRVQYTQLTLALIEETLANLFYNSGVPFEQRRTKIMVGTGAMIEISKLLADDFKNTNPFLVLAGDVKNYLYGNSMNLGYGYRFTSKRFPVAGEVTFEYNPALDNHYNRIQDGLIGEFPIESYTLMVLDITDGNTSNAAAKVKEVEYRVEDGFNDSSNLVLIKPEGWSDTYWGYELGTQHPFGPKSTQGMFSSSQRDGYAIWMKNQSSIWLKDATRSILIEKIKPTF